MALKEIFHVVADEFAVDPNFTTDLVEGMLVQLAGTGTDIYAVPASDTSEVLGVAGDTQSNTTSGTEFADDLVIGATGPVTDPNASTRSTENRVANSFNETLGSGKVTVYHSGGKFATDQYATTDSGSNPITYAPGENLYCDANGQFTNEASASGNVVGLVLETPRDLPSGVPGTDTDDGSLSLGTFLTLKLNV